jgi:hypothetical protein
LLGVRAIIAPPIARYFLGWDAALMTLAAFIAAPITASATVFLPARVSIACRGVELCGEFLKEKRGVVA